MNTHSYAGGHSSAPWSNKRAIVAGAVLFLTWLGVSIGALVYYRQGELSGIGNRASGHLAMIVALYAIVLFATVTMSRRSRMARGIQIALICCATLAFLNRLADFAHQHDFLLASQPWLGAVWPAAVRSAGFATVILLIVTAYLVIQRVQSMLSALEIEKDALQQERDERAAVFDAMKQSENKFQSLADSTAAAIFILQGKRCVYANTAAESMSEFSWRDLYTMHFWEMFVPDERDQIKQLGLTWQANLQKPYSFEIRFLTKNGSIRWGETTVAPIEFEGERAIIGTTFDITNRKEAEQSLEKREEWFRKLVKNTTDVIAVIGADGNLDYLSAPDGALPGYNTKSDLVGKSMFEYVHPEDSERIFAAFQDVVQNPGLAEMQTFRFKQADGDWATVEASGRNLFDDETINGIVVNARNITKRVELENQLRQSQKMDTLGRLAGGVAHDFNNMLTSILVRSELLEYGGQTPEQIQEEVSEIKHAGLKAAGLTRQLLAFSREEEMKSELFDIRDATDDLQKMLIRLMEENIAFTATSTEEPCVIRGDRGGIEQVIMNLVVNARDAMPAGGALSIRTFVESTQESTQAEMSGALERQVVLEVSDTGCGMDEETVSKVFDPFFTTKEVGHGTGLGLSTVFDVVQRLDGHITVNSTPGEGTTFRVQFPYGEPEDTDFVKDSPATKSENCQLSIIVVEDDDEVRILTSRILEHQGHLVYQAENASQALTLVERSDTEVDLVLTDVVMPDVSGPELAEKLRRKKPDLKIMFMSGYTNDAMMRCGLQIDQVAYIDKPFTPDALMKKISQQFEPSSQKSEGPSASSATVGI